MRLKKTIRREYAPLGVYAGYSILSDGATMEQVYNSQAKEYVPDRRITPTIIAPNIQVKTSDFHLSDSQIQAMVQSAIKKGDGRTIEWYVDGVIVGVNENEDFYVDNDGNLVCKRNIEPQTSVDINYMVTLVDAIDYGTIYTMESDVANLTTIDESEDDFSISLECPNKITYNPFIDDLLLYDYKVANEIIQPNESERETYLAKPTSYLKTIKVSVYQGEKRINPKQMSNQVLRLYHVDNEGIEERKQEWSQNGEGVVKDGFAEFTLDFRILNMDRYRLRIENAQDANSIYAEDMLECVRLVPPYEGIIKGTESIPNVMEQHTSELKIKSRGNFIEYPERLFEINWEVITDDSNVNKQAEPLRKYGAILSYKFSELPLVYQQAFNNNARLEELLELESKEYLSIGVIGEDVAVDNNNIMLV